MVVHIAIHRQIKKCNKINNLQIPPLLTIPGWGWRGLGPHSPKFFFARAYFSPSFPYNTSKQTKQEQNGESVLHDNFS